MALQEVIDDKNLKAVQKEILNQQKNQTLTKSTQNLVAVPLRQMQYLATPNESDTHKTLSQMYVNGTFGHKDVEENTPGVCISESAFP